MNSETEKEKARSRETAGGSAPASPAAVLGPDPASLRTIVSLPGPPSPSSSGCDIMSGCSGKPDGPDVTLVMGWEGEQISFLFCSAPSFTTREQWRLGRKDRAS